MDSAAVVNVPLNIYHIIQNEKATYTELQRDLSIEDMYNLLEIIIVENFNLRNMNRFIESKRKSAAHFHIR